jgi:hypothetical protein
MVMRISTSGRSLLRAQHEAFRRLRQGGAQLALFIVLVLGLVEPLACIIHCQLWLPLQMSLSRAAPQLSYHTMPDGTVMEMMAPADASAATPADVRAAGAMTLVDWSVDERLSVERGVPQTALVRCQMGGQIPTDPFQAAPAPYHEMALILLVPTIFALLVRRYVALPWLPPASVYPRPPFRPPIP